MKLGIDTKLSSSCILTTDLNYLVRFGSGENHLYLTETGTFYQSIRGFVALLCDEYSYFLST